nr:uncharacterized protein LOC123747461 [Procambarus clarkii]
MTLLTRSEPKLFCSHISRKLTVNEQVIRLDKSDGGHTENDNDVYEELNKIFQEIFKLELHFPLELRAQTEREIPQESLTEISVTPEELKKELKELDVTKAVRPDKILSWILKEAAEALCSPLAIIFNSSLETEERPENWKRVLVVPF